MLIVCPSCATSYQVEPASLGAAGRSVRCTRCRNMWFASNSHVPGAVGSAHRDDVTGRRTGSPTIAPTAPRPAAPAQASFAPIIEAPPLAPEPDPQAGDWSLAAPMRDDRGPAPLPEPPNYKVLEPPSAAPPAEENPPSAPPEPAEPAPVIDAAPAPPPPAAPVDIETVAARRIRRPPPRRTRKTPAALTTAILLLLAINVGLIAWRAEVVRFLPQTASLFAAIGLPVNLRELVFTEIVTRRESHDGVQVLVVEGNIKSQSRRVADVPRLRFAVRNGGGHEIYTWTALPAHRAIAPGATMPFRSRLASPPPETHAVLVRFFNRRDLGAGIQ